MTISVCGRSETFLDLKHVTDMNTPVTYVNCKNRTINIFLSTIVDWWVGCIGVNPFPNEPWFLRVCSMSLLKTMWEK